MLVHRALVHLGVAEHLFDGVHALAEQVHVELLEARPRDRRVEVDAVGQRVDLDRGLRGGRQRALGALAGGSEAAQRARVARDVLLVLALELLHEEVDEAVVKVLPAQVRVSGGGLDLEDPLLDRQERHVERAAPQVEDEDVGLSGRAALLVEAVGDGRGRRLVDDAHDIEAWLRRF